MGELKTNFVDYKDQHWSLPISPSSAMTENCWQLWH